MRKSIAIDMDNVIADVETHYIDWYEQEHGIRIKKENIAGLPETEAFPDKTAVLRYLYSPGFFRTVPVMPNAQKSLQKLQEKFDVYIVSAAMQFPQSLPEKFEWLQEHFPFITWHRIIFCGDKSKINTDYMIDDHVKNLDAFKGKTILFTASHNIHINTHTRVDHWNAVLEFLEKE